MNGPERPIVFAIFNKCVSNVKKETFQRRRKVIELTDKAEISVKLQGLKMVHQPKSHQQKWEQDRRDHQLQQVRILSVQDLRTIFRPMGIHFSGYQQTAENEEKLDGQVPVRDRVQR